MSKKRMVFPMEVQSGSVTIKIYKVENKGRDSFTVSYFADGKRKLKMFADFGEAFLAIGAFAGLRSAEIERLDWSEIHLADRFIEVKAAKAKTASRRIVPMPENLVKWLAPHAEKEGRVVPFDNVNKQIGWLVEDTNTGLKAAAEKAGSASPRPSPRQSDSGPTTLTRRAATLSRSRERGTGGEGAEPVKFKAAVWKKNALRHSFISYRVADTQNVNQTALECGNSPSIIFKHYRELVRPAEAKKWFGIEPDADGKVMVIPKANEAAVAVA